MKVVLRRLFDGLDRGNVLVTSQLLIGRAKDCDLRPFCPFVSQHHCVIAIDGDSVAIRDLCSRFGTFVNSRRIDGEVLLKSGDRINVGFAFYELRLTNVGIERFVVDANTILRAPSAAVGVMC